MLCHRNLDRGWTLAVLSIRSRRPTPTNRRSPIELPTGSHGDSELAQQLTRDPYVFEFLDLAARRSNARHQQALMDRLKRPCSSSAEASPSRAAKYLDVDGEAFFVDLLLFNVRQLVRGEELKIGGSNLTTLVTRLLCRGSRREDP